MPRPDATAGQWVFPKCCYYMEKFLGIAMFVPSHSSIEVNDASTCLLKETNQFFFSQWHLPFAHWLEEGVSRGQSSPLGDPLPFKEEVVLGRAGGAKGFDA